MARNYAFGIFPVNARCIFFFCTVHTMTDSISDRLREARKVHFKRAVEAAESLGVPYQTYAAHENGNRAFDIEGAILYARRFKVSIDWLLTGAGRGPGGTDSHPAVDNEADVLEFLGRIPGLNDEDHRFLMKGIRSALADNGAEPLRSHPRDQSQPASPRHVSAPSRRRPEPSDA